MHIFELRHRGGASAAAAAQSHSLVAVGLRQSDRCPRSGAADEQCGGSGRGSCEYGACVCEPGWTSASHCAHQVCPDDCAGSAEGPWCVPPNPGAGRGEAFHSDTVFR